MEFAIGFMLGFLLAYVVPTVELKRRGAKKDEPTEEQRRNAEKALREYKNFMTYNGFTSDNEDNT